jgi:hypothetical protein
MVKCSLVLLLAWQGCALVEGDVLIARDAQVISPIDSGDASDAQLTPPMDGGVSALLDASGDASQPNTRGACRIGAAKDGFHDGFAGDALDANTWLVAHGPVTFAQASAQGGFARDNVQVSGGALVLRVRGDLYDGDVRSIDAAGRPLASGKRSAAAVVTRDLFASGTYQIEGRLTGAPAVEVALWLVRDDDSQGAIDISTPGRNGAARSYSHVRMRSRDASAASENQFMLAQSLDDGAAHILRFDWYTTAMSAVSFWVDDELRWQTSRRLPPKAAGRMWIVAWVPDGAAADFDTAEIRIDNAFVTPFGNAGDLCVDGELTGPFLTPP